MILTAVFKEFQDGYAAFIEELPGVNTQGKTINEARRNLVEAVELIFESNKIIAEKSLVGQSVIREPFAVPVL